MIRDLNESIVDDNTNTHYADNSSILQLNKNKNSLPPSPTESKNTQKSILRKSKTHKNPSHNTKDSIRNISPLDLLTAPAKDMDVTKSNQNLKFSQDQFGTVDTNFKENEQEDQSLRNEVIATYDTMKPMNRFSLRNARKRKIMQDRTEQPRAFQNDQI